MSEHQPAGRRCLRCGVESRPDSVDCTACGNTLSIASPLHTPLAARPIATWTPADVGAVPTFDAPASRGPVLHVPPPRHSVPAYIGSPTPAPRTTGFIKGTVIAVAVAALVAGVVWGIVAFSNNLIEANTVDVANSAVAAPEPWITFAPAGGGYSVEFPSQPTTTLEAGNDVYGVEYPGGNSALMVSRTELPRTATTAQIPTVLRGAANAMVGSAGQEAIVVSSDIVKTPSGTTGRLEMRTPDGKIFAQTLVKGRHLYTVLGMIGDRDGELMALNWIRFRDSFRLN